MTCAHRDVVAVLKKGSKIWIGTNFCYNPQKVCPRTPEEIGNYEKCKSICDQGGHAEANACYKAGEDASGAILYLFGHDHCCSSCKGILEQHGVRKVFFL